MGISRRFFVGCAICLLGMMLVGCQSKGPQFKRTTNESHDWHVQMVTGSISQMTPMEDGAWLSGTFRGKKVNERVQVGYKIVLPDHHSGVTYTITKIERDNVIFEYKSWFYHQSFGQTLNTMDEGSFKIYWIRPEVPATRPAATRPASTQ